jgi:hypothetical protein
MRHLPAALLVLLAFGCSIMDPGDRAELDKRIVGLPPSELLDMKRMTMAAKAINWLRHRPNNDQMGKLQCRVQANGRWNDWHDEEPTYTVFDMLDCLIKDSFAVDYMLCKEQWESVETQSKQTELLNSPPIPGGSSLECRFVWDFRYDPAKLPAKLTDPNAITPDDVIDAMIGLPTPPPGLNLPDFVPLLCPMGAGPGWGCPGRPSDPGGGDTPAPGGG